MFILSAAAGAGGTGTMLPSLAMIVVMIAVCYFLLIRPENKRKKQAEEMRSSLKVGDEITTIGGICGRIVAVKEESESVIIETGSDKSKLRVKRWAIGSVDTVHEDDA